MRIVGLVKDLDHVCCRYRLSPFQPFLERAGHTFEIKTWPHSYLPSQLMRPQIGDADVLIWQRRLPSAWQISALRKLAKKLVIDFDDAVFLRNSFHKKGLHSIRLSRRFQRTLRRVDAAVVGNDYLHRRASEWKGRDAVHVIPTHVDVDCYPYANHSHQEGVQMVWIGSKSTLPSLELLREPLEQLGRLNPHLNLKMICDTFLDFRSIKPVRCAWSKDTERQELANADIGVSWLPDDAWSRGKCGLKVLQYMAAGLPVVANRVGVQCDMIRDKETGFLVDSGEEFIQAVTQLSRDPALRQAMGQAGRETAKRHFDVSVGAEKWMRVLDRLAA